jgi:predicted dehydrogenase
MKTSRPPRRTAVSRRQFLGTAATLGLAAPYVLHSIGRAAPSANGKLNHACIGVGGMGAVDLREIRSHPNVQIVALCDVDANHLQQAAQTVPGARLYADWRELLEREGDKIDSVTVSVPDHMHYPIALTAIRMGKHVYCQKPMCHDVAEVRALTRASIDAKAITQLGTQGAASRESRTAVQWLKDGVIGKIKHVYLCSNRPGAIEQYRLKGPRPVQQQDPPAHVNWDLWIGNAPWRSYAPDIYHPAKWRAWIDFGTGWSGDIGCHVFDATWKGLELEAPRSVEAEVQSSWAESKERRHDTWPQGDHITWIFPGNKRTASRDLTVEWFDGEFYPPREIRELYTKAEGIKLEEYPPESSMVIGTEGALCLGGRPVLLPKEKFAGYTLPDLPARNHYHHFVEACLGGEKTASNFAQTGPMTEAVLLGTVAIRAPFRRLNWDAKGMRITNDKEANGFIRRDYRAGWEVKL